MATANRNPPSCGSATLLVLQRQVVMSVSAVVTDACACLAGSSPGGPVHGMVDHVPYWGGDAVEQAADFVGGQWDQWFVGAGGGSPFLAASRVMTRNAAASMDKLVCRYHGS